MRGIGRGAGGVGLFFALWLTFPQPSDAQKGTRPAPVIRTEPPAGFENLTRAREFEVDVVFDGRKLGRAHIILDGGDVRLKDPRQLLGMLRGLRQPERVRAVLRGRLPANIDKLCRIRPNKSDGGGCDRLAPEIAGVVLDEERQSLLLFIHDDYLEPWAIRARRFLTPPEREPSLVSRFDGAVSGGVEQVTRYTFRNVSILGFGEGRVRAETSLSDTNGFFAETLAAELDGAGWLYRAGLFRNFGSPLLPDVQAYGVGMASSTEARIDRDQVFGSQMRVFLQRDAFVDILRDGRLLSTRFYSAGTQFLDTSQLPGGAYNVTLRIRDVGGGTREETRFYTKTELIPPHDQPLYRFSAGVIAEPRTSGLAPPSSTAIARAGASFRVHDTVALGADVLATNREGAFESNVFVFSEHARIGAGGLATTAGDYGLQFSAAGNYRRLGVSINARYVRAARARIADITRADQFRFVNGSSIDAGLAVSYVAETYRVGLTGFWRRADQLGRRESYAIGPNATVELMRSAGHLITADFSFAKSDLGYAGFARLTWRWDSPPSITAYGEAGARATRTAGRSDLGALARAEATYRFEAPGYNLVTVTPNILRDGPTIAGLDGSIEGPFGRGNVAARHTLAGGARDTGFGATFSTGAAIDRRGVGVGGLDSNMAAVVVRLAGPASTGAYRVRVNGSPRLTLNAGQTRILFLEPYKSYEIALERTEDNAQHVQLRNVSRRIVLYPGTARTLEWNAQPVVVVFGRALRADGTPVAGAIIEGADSAGETDALGYFQVEIARPGRLDFVERGKRNCSARIDALPRGNEFASIGGLNCI